MLVALYIVGAVVIVAAVVVLAYLCLMLLRQNGRLLERIEALEEAMRESAAALATERQLAVESRLAQVEARMAQTEERLAQAQERLIERAVARATAQAQPRNGAAAPEPGPRPAPQPAPAVRPDDPFQPGQPAPAVRAPDLDGKRVSLGDFKGKRVVAVMWNPGCGFCDMIAPGLAESVAALRQRNTELVLLAHGNRADNRRLLRERGLQVPTLLVDEAQPRTPGFSNYGTPTAFLIDERGVVARGPEVGANNVPALIRELLAAPPGDTATRLPGEKPLTESRIEREGLRPGTPAPVFRLPDLDGRVRSLAEYRGQKVLVVFSDPNCGPCLNLAPKLQAAHASRGSQSPHLIMVSRGSPEENRQKAGELGLTFPIVLQDKWKTSKEFGIFATPVAFLIDEQGKVAQEVAIGEEAILNLVNTVPTG